MPHVPRTPDRVTIVLPDGTRIHRHLYRDPFGAAPEAGWITLRGRRRYVRWSVPGGEMELDEERNATLDRIFLPPDDHYRQR